MTTETPSLESMNLLTADNVAKAAGLTVGSVRVMVVRARHRREEGRALVTDLPAPDLTVFRSPLWRKSTITKWIKTREKVFGTQDSRKSAPPRKATPKKSSRKTESASKTAKKS